MPELGSITRRIRSKNAGPFWLTIDIFCGDAETYTRVRDALPTSRVAALYKQSENAIRRFDMAELNVVKFSMPRQPVQGSREDRDMHASQWGWLLSELEVD